MLKIGFFYRKDGMGLNKNSPFIKLFVIVNQLVIAKVFLLFWR